MAAPTDAPQDKATPPGFQSRGDSALDRLASAFYAQGSINDEGERVLPPAMREAAEGAPPAEAPPAEAPPAEAPPAEAPPAEAPPAEAPPADGEPGPAEDERVEASTAGDDSTGTEAGPELADAEDADAVVEVVVSGERQQIPLAELVKGYQQEAAYTKKSAALAEERRGFDAERARIVEAVQGRLAEMDRVAQVLRQEWIASMPDPKVMERLKVEDPGEYAAKMLEIQQRNAMLSQVDATRAKINEQMRHDRADPERALLAEAMPETFGPERFRENYHALTAWMLSPTGGGLRQEEWDEFGIDHRVVRLAQLAKERVEQLQAAREKPARVQRNLRDKPRVLRPRAPRPQGETEEEGFARSMAALEGKGVHSNREVADAFLAFSRMNRAKREPQGSL